MSNNTVPIEFDIGATGARTGLAPVAPRERHLGLVDEAAQPKPRRRRVLSPLVGALTAVGIVLAIFAVQLGLSIMTSQGAYEMRSLQNEQRDLMRVERVLQQNVDKLSSPQNLSTNAAELGMVQNSQPATLRLSDHKVLGALSAETTAAASNNVPNETLENMPVVDADGLLVDRRKAAGAAAAQAPPVPWKDDQKLPAPHTH